MGRGGDPATGAGAKRREPLALIAANGVDIEPNDRQLRKLTAIHRSEPTFLILDQWPGGEILCSVRARFLRRRLKDPRSMVIDTSGRISEFDPFS